MKKTLRLFSVACAHLSLIWSLMLLTFYITDRFNTAMAFINHDMTKILIQFLSLTTMITVVRLIGAMRAQGHTILRLIAGIGAGLSALTALTLLVLDRSMVSRFEAGLSTLPPLLFTNDSVKAALALLAVTSIFAAILFIVLDRKATPCQVEICEVEE